MQKSHCVLSAGNKESFIQLVNKYFYSQYWTLTGDNKLFNTKLNQYLEGYIVLQKKNRIQLFIITEA